MYLNEALYLSSFQSIGQYKTRDTVDLEVNDNSKSNDHVFLPVFVVGALSVNKMQKSA